MTAARAHGAGKSSPNLRLDFRQAMRPAGITVLSARARAKEGSTWIANVRAVTSSPVRRTKNAGLEALP
jgi:hypothetical protein